MSEEPEVGRVVSNFGRFSGGEIGIPEVNGDLLRELIEALSSATRDERTEDNIRAEDEDAVSFAASAAAADLLLSSSLVFKEATETVGWSKEDEVLAICWIMFLLESGGIDS